MLVRPCEPEPGAECDGEPGHDQNRHHSTQSGFEPASDTVGMSLASNSRAFMTTKQNFLSSTGLELYRPLGSKG